MFIYRSLWYLLWPFWAMLHLLFIWRRPEFRQDYWQRYGWAPKNSSGEQPLIIHAASVGEVNAVTLLVQELITHTNIPLLITTTSATGRDRVNQLFAKQGVRHCYLPFDLGIAHRLFLSRIKPRGLLLVETELWPNLLRLCHQRNLPVWLINGRLSQKSAQRYKRFSRLTQDMLKRLQCFLVQDEATAKRFAYIGAPPRKIEVIGNTKFDWSPPPVKQPNLHDYFIDDKTQCWVCGSTREGEEAILLQAYASMSLLHDSLLIIVPRHPQRFEEVADLCTQSALPWQRFSDLLPDIENLASQDASGPNLTKHKIFEYEHEYEQANKPSKKVLLVDAMGWLVDFYWLADLVLVGGSLVPKGGQNPLEPAALGKPVVMGPHTYNFAQVCELLHQAGNLHLLKPADLINTIPNLLSDTKALKEAGQAGAQLISQQRGATDAYVQKITHTFSASKQKAQALNQTPQAM